MTEEAAEKARFCEKAIEAAKEAVETPPESRGYYLAALANHVRECGICGSQAQVEHCRHGEPENDCSACAACAACDGSCGVCPFVPRTSTGQADH